MPEVTSPVRRREGLGRGRSYSNTPPPRSQAAAAAFHVATDENPTSPGLAPRPTIGPGEWGAAAGPLGSFPFFLRRSLPGLKETCRPLLDEPALQAARPPGSCAPSCVLPAHLAEGCQHPFFCL